jgi:hypothetical protein
MADEEKPPRISLGYAFGQLAKALTSSGETASKRLRQWQQVIAGVTDGTLNVGSRTPVRNTPAWVTLEVAHGGFATGAFAASGPLQEHELAKLPELGDIPNGKGRAALNLFYAGEAGRGELMQRLSDGRYRVTVPEEAALLVAMWLQAHGEEQRAQSLLEVLMPYFDQLRFFPVPHSRPDRASAGVCIQNVGDCVAKLRAQKPHAQFQRMREAIQVWAPLYDRAVALFLETVEGEMPTLSPTVGDMDREANGSIVQGGWPCKRYPDDWKPRAQQLLEDYRAARRNQGLCGKPERPKENFARLRGYMKRCIDDSATLTGRDVGAIRRILASYVARHGAPGSERLDATRSAQLENARRPAHHLVARVLEARLQGQAPDEGLPDPRPFISPLARDEADRIGACAGHPIPDVLANRIERCLEAPLEKLVACGLISSSEVMARLVPVLTALARAGAIAEPDLQRVYAAVYRAFRRRRSLLLLDLESQVRFDELPWVSAVSPWVGATAQHRSAARETLVQVATLAIRTFPHTILPNPMVKELRALASAAGEPVPFVEELAADIFMGAFSETFLRAAQVAARFLRGTLYERYYGLPYDRVLALDDIEKRRFGTSDSPGFAVLCAALAGTPRSSSVAANGTVIEQSQLLTTHNLAVLFDRFGLLAPMRPCLPQLARQCFEWVCRRQQSGISEWKARLQMTKNAAYAWRQMLFFLSFCDQGDLAGFVDWATGHVQKCRPDFRARFEPVMAGLRTVVAGHAFGADGIDVATGGRRFLGWSVGSHWLLTAMNGDGHSQP